MYNAVVVANTILRIREEQSGLIGPMDKIRLHRFCYFAQGWYLARFDQPLFDNPIERWGVGPVIQEVIIRYHELRGEGTACFSWQRNRRFSFVSD